MSKPCFAIALALIRHPSERRFLIALRKPDAHVGEFWEFPGGKCGPDETLAECAIREAREEVGLVVTIEEAWPPVTFEYPERMVTLHPFLCRAASAAARALENRQVTWAAPEELERFSFPPANAPLLARLLSLQETP